MKKIVSFLCGISLVLSTAVATASSASAETSSSAASTITPPHVVNDNNQQSIIDVFEGINAFRASKQLSPLKFNVTISGIAQKWSTFMASNDVFHHNSDYVTGAPEGWDRAGENIAARWDRSGQGLVDQWIGSPGHNAIMSDPTYDVIGIGIAYTNGTGDPANRYPMYGTTNFFSYNTLPADTYNHPRDYFATLNAPTLTPGNLVAIDRAGAVWNYGTRDQGGRTRVFASGWLGAKEVFVVDWNSDGVQDLLAQLNDGRLLLKSGRSSGGFGAFTDIGRGWGSYEITVGKWKTADRFPSILAKDFNGNLWNYPNLSGLRLSPRVLEGTGWGSLEINQQDWDKNGTTDLLARNRDGKILLYRTDGAGSFVAEPRRIIGSGWGGITITTIKGYTGPGSEGLLARNSGGLLYYYGTAASRWLTRTYEGAGWTSFNLAAH